MADATVRLQWVGKGLEFEGGAPGGPQVRFDGDGKAGISPVQTLIAALAGCMGADVVDIAVKSRVQFSGLEVVVEGDRRADPPRRYTKIVIRITVHGAAEADRPKLQRALDLSRDTYCSVLHSIREDIPVDTELVLA